MNEPKPYQAIMLSSTFTDLKQHRQRAINAIEKFGYRANVMEYDGARADANVIESSLKMLRHSAGYICVISLKYGQTPFDPDENPDRLSITEIEFNEAMRLGRPIVLFVMDENHLIRKADVESDPDKLEKLNAFRERAKRMGDSSEVERVYEMFETLDQFSTAAAIAVGRLVQNLNQRATNERSLAVIAAAEVAHPPRPLSNIPVNVPRHFLGRNKDLAAINAALKGNRGRVAITVLHGLRGIGKTTLAAAYAEKHAADYRATWWIRAETETTMRADLAGLGVRLGWVVPDEKEEPALALVLERLSAGGDSILLVYDNANNADEIGPYVPHGGGAHIIATSNAPNWSGVAEAVEIEKWPKEIGADYLVAQAGRPNEYGAAVALSTALDGLPLAHEQAAAYCARTGLSLADYRKKFEAEPTKFLNAEKDASPGYYNRRTVAKTFALAIDEAAKLHHAAESLIVYAALLAPEPIPLYLFSEATERFGEAFASAIASDGLDEAVAALRAFALIDRKSISDERDPKLVTDCIRLHQLVRQVAAARCEGDTREEALRSLVEALAQIYPDDIFNNPHSWPRARRLVSLAIALVGNDDNFPKESELMAAKLLSRISDYKHRVLAEFDEARNLLERALLIQEKILGPDHLETTMSVNNLGLILRSQGDLAGAQQCYERALAIREKTLGSDDLALASTLNNLGYALQEQGDFERSYSYYHRALAIREKKLAPDHPDTALSLNNLGVLLQARGDFGSARPLYERALAIRERKLGPDHLDTANSLNNLGHLLWNEGSLADARPLYERALAIREMALGPNHPDTANSLNNLGALLDTMGHLADARALYERALAIREKTHGPNHPNTATSLDNLGGLLQRQGDLVGARSYFERALTIREKALGPGHSESAISLNNLGQLLLDEGDPAGARSFQERALTILEATLGPKHPLTRTAAENTARVLGALGLNEEAKTLRANFDSKII